MEGPQGVTATPDPAGLSGERRAEGAGASCRAPALGAGWGHPAPRPFQVSPSPSSVLPASRNLAGKREPGHLVARVSFTVLRSNWLSGSGTAASRAVRQHATRAGPHLGVLFAGVPVGLWWAGPSHRTGAACGPLPHVSLSLSAAGQGHLAGDPGPGVTAAPCALPQGWATRGGAGPGVGAGPPETARGRPAAGRPPPRKVSGRHSAASGWGRNSGQSSAGRICTN